MPSVVVPFRAGKSRLALPPGARTELGLSMLRTVVEAAREVGPTLLVTEDAELAVRLGVEHVPEPGGGQGPAVAAGVARARELPLLVVNADLPRATADDLRALAAAAPALVAAPDGTTNALAVDDPAAFRPLYGPGSAARYEAAGLRPLRLRNLAADVDVLADLERFPVRPCVAKDKLPRAGRRPTAARAVQHKFERPRVS
jgi:2-phospho-L-lactate guanylyltransferase (CobY/MobA/RfbA family)